MQPICLVILSKEVEGKRRLVKSKSRKLFYTICHGSEIRFAFKSSNIGNQLQVNLMNVLGLYSDLGLFSTVYAHRVIQFSNVEAHTTRKIFHTKDHTIISYGDPTMVYKHRILICSMTTSTWGYIKYHLVTDDRSNWKRLLSGAVALSHCIFHSVTTCSTPSRCVPLRHDLAIQKYALTNIHNYVIPWWRTI